MTRDYLRAALIRYGEKFPTEYAHTQACIALLESEHCFERSNPGHFTASAWVVDKNRTSVLLTHHKKFNRWIQLGGHTDGSEDVFASALREAYEESGLSKIVPLSGEIFDIDIHPIPNACVAHYDIRYIFGTEDTQYHVSDESHDLAWVPLAKVPEYNSGESLTRLVAKTAEFALSQKQAHTNISVPHTLV